MYQTPNRTFGDAEPLGRAWDRVQERWQGGGQRGAVLDASKAALLSLDASVSPIRAADRAINRTRWMSDAGPAAAWSVPEP